ncbi:ATP-binding cassette domain-containing protein [Knoellia koreensis]|uniref:ATP-binding cassette domain-containing protein n=1 Tax=Knoellia koreensis TaxID=2730921 RepID=UPI00197E0722
MRVTGAQKSYRARRGEPVHALDDVTVEARAGELLTVVGPSGSGKSTLLRAIAGLETLDAGSVMVGDVDVTALAPGRRGVAMVFQDAALYPHLSVAGNIGLGERARGRGRSQTRERVAEVAESLGIGELLDRLPSQLSGGERQRVALARAVIRAPKVCLLDEPLSSLDADLRLRMRGEVRDLQRRTGATMVHVTHDQAEAMAIGDRLAVMQAGRVVQVDTPERVFAEPATSFVARFVGPLPMNLLTGDGPTRGVRPERVRLRDNAAGDVDQVEPGLSGLAGVVESVESAGEDAVVRVRHAGGVLLARVTGTSRPSVGDQLRAVWDAGDEHRFDRDTGERL